MWTAGWRAPAAEVAHCLLAKLVVLSCIRYRPVRFTVLSLLPIQVLLYSINEQFLRRDFDEDHSHSHILKWPVNEGGGEHACMQK